MPKSAKKNQGCSQTYLFSWLCFIIFIGEKIYTMKKNLENKGAGNSKLISNVRVLYTLHGGYFTVLP